MPEISKDNFELLNPSDALPTPNELRARANSSSADDRRVSRSISSTTAEEIAQAQSSTRQLRLMSESNSSSPSGSGYETPKNTFVGFKKDYSYGYKREITHRYVSDFIHSNKSDNRLNNDIVESII